MQIYVGKNGQQLGPFSLEEVNRKLADGTFTGSDLAWYEGAAGWAPLSRVAGVVIPPPATPAPTPAPAPAPVQPAPVAPVRPNAPIVQRPKGNTRTLSVVTWALLGITFLVSFIPVVGCGAWLLGLPVAITAIILGIVMLTRGGTGSGILAILGGVLIVPLCFLAQFLSLMVFGGTVERKEMTQIKENLLLIDSAKTKWIAENKATDGTPVTMASLKSQLGGKEVKPTIDEAYDPMPVGQPPTATLPANKTLGTFTGGDVLTVATIETALANSSAFNWNFRNSTTASPAPSIASTPRMSPKPSPSAAPSVEPSVTASPKPSVSPKSSATPHSLISPRQREETEESPSSRPSPSAKFAPRKGPQMNPRQSPSEREESGGLRQGKQKPGDQPPSESPSPSPDDDDE